MHLDGSEFDFGAYSLPGVTHGQRRIRPTAALARPMARCRFMPFELARKPRGLKHSARIRGIDDAIFDCEKRNHSELARPNREAREGFNSSDVGTPGAALVAC